MNNTPVENTNDVKITTKIYPMKYKNRKGFQIGNMKIKFDTKNAPFTSRDQVDLYLNELFSYIKWASTKKHPDDESVEDMKKTIHDFLKAKKIEHVFSPKVIVGKGKKQTKKRQIKGGKSKTNKRKMKLQKGGDMDDDVKKYINDAIQKGYIDQLDRMLELHPKYAEYALNRINMSNISEATEDDIKDMKETVKIIIDKNKNKDN